MRSETKGVLLRNGNPQGDPMNAPRCGARTRRGLPSQGPAMAKGRCRMHGGKSTGPRTPKGLKRSRTAHLKHVHYSAQSIALRRQLRQLFSDSRETIGDLRTLGAFHREMMAGMASNDREEVQISHHV